VAKQRVEVTGRHFGRDTASKAWSRIWLLPELDQQWLRSMRSLGACASCAAYRMLSWINLMM
jgi:hypothetical protein